MRVTTRLRPSAIPRENARVTVTVPDGLNSGEEFTISFNETEYTVAVPDGVRGGEEIDLEIAGGAQRVTAALRRRRPRCKRWW